MSKVLFQLERLKRRGGQMARILAVWILRERADGAECHNAFQ